MGIETLQTTESNTTGQPILSDRRAWLTTIIGSGAIASIAISNPVFHRALAQEADAAAKAATEITAEMVQASAWVADVKLTPDQCALVAAELNGALESTRALRTLEIDVDTPMANAFVPYFFVDAMDRAADAQVATKANTAMAIWRHASIELPAFNKITDAAFWSVQQLGLGLRTNRFTSVELTRMYLDRLKQYDPTLKCVVTLNEAAIASAERADELLAEGTDLGPLHGIPWGAKDIIAIPGMPTTWGAGAYRDRTLPNTATVAKKLEGAGAVLLGKLSVGTLAWGDEWHGGMTRDPWNPERGSSGSSAGSACAVAAGLCGFAIGSETLGSIVSPTRTCSTNGLRPTFGRVSRAGCMTLAWTMDKLGPICRSIDDCAVVFRAMLGADGLDPTVVDREYSWPLTDWDIKKLRIGVLDKSRPSESMLVEHLKKQGVAPETISFKPAPQLEAIVSVLGVEASAMHGKLFHSIQEDAEIGKWAPTMRESQFKTAVDYVRAMRARVALIQETEAELRKVDVLIGDGDLARMNLTGHPSLVVAMGKQPDRDRPQTVVLTGRMFSESQLLMLGAWIQEQLPPTPQMPSLTAV